jgi:hypothetical protein
MSDIVICDKMGTTPQCKSCPFAKPFRKEDWKLCNYAPTAFAVTKVKMTIKEINGAKIKFSKKGQVVGVYAQVINDTDHNWKELLGKVVWVWLSSRITVLRIAKH